MPPLRSSLLLAVVLALVFASGAGAAQLDFDDDLDMLRVVDFSAAADQLTIHEGARSHEVTDPSGTLADNSGLCTAIAGGFRCPKATSVAVDLGAQDDVFRGPTVTVPMAIAGGGGDDDILGGASQDVLDRRRRRGPASPAAPASTSTSGRTTTTSSIRADGIAERISCGGGTDDQVRNYFIDIIAECERGFDADRRRLQHRADCNDAGGHDLPGRTGDPRERDRRGLRRPRCRQPRPRRGRLPGPGGLQRRRPPRSARARSRSGATTSTRTATARSSRSPPMRAGVVDRLGLLGADVTRLQSMVVRSAPPAARSSGSCSGRAKKHCPFSNPPASWTVPRDLAPVPLRGLTLQARLRPGARITVVVSAPASSPARSATRSSATASARAPSIDLSCTRRRPELRPC